MNFCWARTLFFIVIVVLGTSSMISACGQKGPLYLPDDEKKAKKYNKKEAAQPTSKK